MKWNWIVAAILCVVMFASCGESEFRTCITTEKCDATKGKGKGKGKGPQKRRDRDRCGVEYEIRFDGESVAIVHGDTTIYMPGDVECVAAVLMESGHVRLEMAMTRSRDNAIFFGGDRCVSVAESDLIGEVCVVCRTGNGRGCDE